MFLIEDFNVILL